MLHRDSQLPCAAGVRLNQTGLLVMLLLIALQWQVPSVAVGQRRDRYETARQLMVQTVIKAEGISDERVLNALLTVPRHEFVAGSLRNQAYTDKALPIGSQQTISAPYIVAYMTETLGVQPDHRVLEIGTGSGYQAAVLSTIAKDVYSIEIVETLAESATERLTDLGYDNVHVKHGDGYKGWPDVAPFDRIIVTCSPESVPEPLISQLKEGGRMIIPMGERYQQSFFLMKKEDGALVEEKLVPTLFVPMTGGAEEIRRVKPDPNHPMVVNGGFETDANGDGRIDGWHYQRQSEMCSEEQMGGSFCHRFTNSVPGEMSQILQGTAVNGRRLGAVDFSIWARRDSVVTLAGENPAGLVVHFYDSVRREVGTQVVFVWRGTENWQQFRRRIRVPATAREMIVRIGLNGSVGILDVDSFQFAGVAK
ncbi:MAG: protein-L-isoaspartate(D-aspartate) O-methyltransferase [Fuerstiella sp.]